MSHTFQIFLSVNIDRGSTIPFPAYLNSIITSKVKVKLSKAKINKVKQTNPCLIILEIILIMNLQICPWNHQNDQNDIFHRRDFCIRPSMSVSLPIRLKSQPSKGISVQLQGKIKTVRYQRNYFNKEKQAQFIKSLKQPQAEGEGKGKAKKLDQIHHRLYTYSQYNKSTSEFRDKLFQSSPKSTEKIKAQIFRLQKSELKSSSARPLTSVSRSLRTKVDDINANNKTKNIKIYRSASAAKNRRNKAAYEQGIKPKLDKKIDPQILINQKMSLLIDMVRNSRNRAEINEKYDKTKISLLKNSNSISSLNTNQSPNINTNSKLFLIPPKKGSFVYFNRQFQYDH